MVSSTRRKVFLICGEYSAHPRTLSPEKHRSLDFLRGSHPYANHGPDVDRLFFRQRRRSDEEVVQDTLESGRPVVLKDLLASAGHRALCSLHNLIAESGKYQATRHRVTHLIASSMPGLDPNERLNIGLIPQGLRAMLGLSFRCQCHFQVGTSDSGAWAFAEAVRLARASEQPATVLVVAGQMIPSGYAAQYHIRSVLGERDQSRGLDMLAAGDLWMDIIRRNYGVSRDDIQVLLRNIATRKFHAAVDYPAAMLSGERGTRDTAVTPYFDRTDVAPPCCGAAATIVTSDENLIGEIARSSSVYERYRSAPIVEVLGIGEGSSNPNLLDRQSPLVFTPAIRQAFSAAADDALVPPSVFAGSAFAVLHDAFPSIELSFLLSLGFDWDSATYRIQQYWPNPFGGLVTFGHALGASGLVQVVKALHTFAGDSRYVRRPTEQGQGGEPPHGFPDDGSFAFTTSVGGPLSHIVVTLLRGGHAPLSKTSTSSPSAVLSPGTEADQWHGRRQQLRKSMHVYLRRLRAALRRAQGGDAWLVEGVSRVNIRSCLRELRVQDILQLNIDGLERYFEDHQIPNVMADLHAILIQTREVWQKTEDFESRSAAYDDGIWSCVSLWHEQGILRREPLGPERRRPAATLDDKGLVKRVTDALKERLGMQFVVLAKATEDGIHREMRFLPLTSVTAMDAGTRTMTAADLHANDILLCRNGDGDEELYDIIPAETSADILPWWNSRAIRRDGTAQHPHAPRSAGELLTFLQEESAASVRWERQVDLDFLRTYFSPFIPDVAIELAMQVAGVRDAAPSAKTENVPVALYWNDIITRADGIDWRTACEVNGEAVNQARGWLGMYMINAVQSSGSVRLVSFDERLRHGVGAQWEALVSAARFARDVALWSLRHGVRLRAVISIGVDGVRFSDVNHNVTATSAAETRVRALLEHVTAVHEQGDTEGASIAKDATWICFDLTHVGVADIARVLAQRLPSWTLLRGSTLKFVRSAVDESIEFAVWSYSVR